MIQEGSKEEFVDCLAMGQVFFICYCTLLSRGTYLVLNYYAQFTNEEIETLSNLPHTHAIVNGRAECLTERCVPSPFHLSFSFSRCSPRLLQALSLTPGLSVVLWDWPHGSSMILVPEELLFGSLSGWE